VTRASNRSRGEKSRLLTKSFGVSLEEVDLGVTLKRPGPDVEVIPAGLKSEDVINDPLEETRVAQASADESSGQRHTQRNLTVKRQN